ncbi:fumarylacetoacetate hydrolase family protein [Alkalihalobacillus sp. LMS39]|uniref:fumarylacetoacetate hydrolase family protein n=1 Tax=Alkalihalobacillus sp. LMS39 TaxID=2924032 RepID=UPI001FB37543|nr:fumarylacetoacetate hydrolase family protein [Alkalihalobacillus sp. LMS39]UOE93237.1 fumarylacetoacetate hydrolase family protein [Alkalihalobacillus sp. LMS39]
MRFVTFIKDGVETVGVYDNKQIIDIQQAASAMELPQRFPNTLVDCLYEDSFVGSIEKVLMWVSEIDWKEAVFEWDDPNITVVAPIPTPRKNIFCIGKNYAAHAIEMGSEADIPKDPIVFSKAPTTVIGPEAKIHHHQTVTAELDYEGEIAIVIGKKGRGIRKEEAYDYIFGYTLLNDITARDLQRKHKQYLIGKSLDTTCPMGPWITHKSQVEKGGHFHLETKVNDEVRQSASTEQFIFDIPTIIETISQGITLEPGDIIATGTPAGVGNGFSPPKFLQSGDVIEISVKELGVLRNQVE